MCYVEILGLGEVLPRAVRSEGGAMWKSQV